MSNPKTQFKHSTFDHKLRNKQKLNQKKKNQKSTLMISQLSCIEFCKFQIKSRKNFRQKGSIFQTQNERLQETTTDSSNEMEMQCERKKLQDVEISIIDNSRKKILRERESLPIFSL